MLELVHAWAAETASGQSGFATVLKSHALSPESAAVLEARSGLEIRGDLPTPVLAAHRILKLDGEWCSVLSHIQRGPDVSDSRPVRTSHHLVLSRSEQPHYGPVSLLRSGWFLANCDGLATERDTPPLPAEVHTDTEEAVNDAWATALSDHVLRGTGFIARLPDGVEAIEALSQLERAMPHDRLWNLTFLIGGAAYTDGVLARFLSHEAPVEHGAHIVNLSEPAPDPRDPEEQDADVSRCQPTLSIEPPTHRISLFVLLAIIILVGIVALVLWNGWTA